MTTSAANARRCRPKLIAYRVQAGSEATREELLDSLTLPEAEEVAGELHRRIAVALRRLGEPRADQPDAEGHSARWRAAALAAAVELAAATLGAVAAGTAPPTGRSDRHPSSVAAVMYAAPTLQGLVTRLEQDRRLLASLARALESRFDEQHQTPWGAVRLRHLVREAEIAEPARCAQALERHVEQADAPQV